MKNLAIGRRLDGPQLWLALLCVACATFQAEVLFPGIIYADSFSQYQEALTGTFSDWHPPIMALFWRAQIKLLGTADLFYAIHIVGLWVSLFLVFRHLRSALISSIAVVLVGFMPPFFGLIGVVWKDVTVAVSAMLATSLMLDALLSGRRLGLPRGAVVIILLGYAALARANAPFLIGPLLVWALVGWRILSWRIFASGLVALAFIGVTPFVNHNLIGANDSKAIVSLEVFDLGGISQLTRRNELPGDWSPDESQKIIERCYTPIYWDVYAWGDCKFVNEKVDRSDLSHVWIEAIRHQPEAYLVHRLANFNSLLRLVNYPEAYNYYVMVGPGYQSDASPRPARVYTFYRDLMAAHPAQLWHFPFVWLAFAIGMFVATFPNRSDFEAAINVINFAAVAYVAGYFIVGVGSDFRYILPSLYVTTLSIVAVVAWRQRSGEWIGTRSSRALGASITALLLAAGFLL